MALQLFKYAAKAAAWSSSCQPSILVKLSGSTCALRNFISCAAAGRPAAAIRHNTKLADSKPAPSCERGGNAAMRSLPGFGCDQFPVRIARRQIAGECPDVGDVDHLLGIAVDHVAVLVARRRHQLGVEAHGQLRGAPARNSAAVISALSMETKRLSTVSPRFSRSAMAVSNPSQTSRDSKFFNVRRSPSAKALTIIS